MLAYCGLECTTCPIHVATLEPDPLVRSSLRARIAQQCTEVYGMPVKAEEVTDCDGCTSQSGRLFSGCMKCGIRSCARERRLLSCAFCSDYPCAALLSHFTLDPEAQSRLEMIRSSQKQH